LDGPSLDGEPRGDNTAMKVFEISGATILALLLGVGTLSFAQHEQEGDHAQQGGHEQGESAPQHEQRSGQSEHHQQPEPAQHAQQQQHAEHNQEQAQHAQQQEQHVQQQQQVQHDQQQRQAEHNEQQAQHEQQQHAQQQQQAQHNQQQHAQQQQAQHNQQQHAQHQQQVRQSAWQQHRSQNWQSDHRTWQQRGGYHGYRIPDDRYRGYFGPSHGFRINGLPFLVVGGYPRFQYQGYWISAVDPWPDQWGNNWYDNDDVYVNYVDNGYYLYNRRYPSSGIAINITL
jgi:glucan-binding YG repeat protein